MYGLGNVYYVYENVKKHIGYKCLSNIRNC